VLVIRYDRKAQGLPYQFLAQFLFFCRIAKNKIKFQAVMIPHTSVIANIIQMATHNQIDKGGNQASNQSYLPGDVALGGKLLAISSHIKLSV
jgi:hypothetical protein